MEYGRARFYRDLTAIRGSTRLLFRSQQKKVMDLPAQYLDPLFENWLTRLLCATPVTPNMVTLMGAATGVLVAWLFWHGLFVARTQT